MFQLRRTEVTPEAVGEPKLIRPLPRIVVSQGPPAEPSLVTSRVNKKTIPNQNHLFILYLLNRQKVKTGLRGRFRYWLPKDLTPPVSLRNGLKG
jgi:hypothetical protein